MAEEVPITIEKPVRLDLLMSDPNARIDLLRALPKNHEHYDWLRDQIFRFGTEQEVDKDFLDILESTGIPVLDIANDNMPLPKVSSPEVLEIPKVDDAIERQVAMPGELNVVPRVPPVFGTTPLDTPQSSSVSEVVPPETLQPPHTAETPLKNEAKIAEEKANGLQEEIAKALAEQSPAPTVPNEIVVEQSPASPFSREDVLKFVSEAVPANENIKPEVLVAAYEKELKKAA